MTYVKIGDMKAQEVYFTNEQSGRKYLLAQRNY